MAESINRAPVNTLVIPPALALDGNKLYDDPRCSVPPCSTPALGWEMLLLQQMQRMPWKGTFATWMKRVCLVVGGISTERELRKTWDNPLQAPLRYFISVRCWGFIQGLDRCNIYIYLMDVYYYYYLLFFFLCFVFYFGILSWEGEARKEGRKAGRKEGRKVVAQERYRGIAL